MILLFSHRKLFLKCKLKQFYTYLPPFNMNRMIFFNLVYKIKQAKTVKSGVVDRLLMAYI